MLLVATTTLVFVVGDNYAPIIAKQSNAKSTGLLAQTLSYSNETTSAAELVDASELVLAENTTSIGRASETLLDAFANMPETTKSQSELDRYVTDFKEQIADLKTKSLEELSKTDNGSDEFNDYKNAVVSGYSELDSLLSDVTVSNYESVMSAISDLINPEKPHISLAEDLPFNDVSEENISYAAYNPEAVTDYQIADGGYSSDDLQQTNDTVINDDVRAEFSELESVLDVYQYIKNNYAMEYYFGSRKGAVGASAEKAGNDYDIASLLIGVLRDRNIPARYAKGEIEITAEQAMEWTATDDINVAMRAIAALGIPTTGMISNGETVAVRLEHVWVETYVPYTDYRGTGNRSGERLWIPLDASFKKSIHYGGTDPETLGTYMSDESNYLHENSVINDVDVSSIAAVVSGEESAFIKYALENSFTSIEQVLGGKVIYEENLGYLPLTLPYNTISGTERFVDISENYTDTINIRLFGNMASGTDITGNNYINKTIYAPDVYGKRLTLSYIPATEADKELLVEYGNIFSVPAYLLKLKPQFSVDGNVAAEGPVCNAGYMQKYDITISNRASGQNDSHITNTVTVGGMYAIVLDYGNISSDEFNHIYETLGTSASETDDTDFYTDSCTGKMLNAIGKMYFSNLDQYNSVCSGLYNITATRALSLGIVGFGANVTYAFGKPSELTEGGVFLDIGHDVRSVVSNSNTKEDEKGFMFQTGIHASAMEHGILEEVTGIESVSTIKTFQYAVENNIPIHYITKENLESEIAQISFSDELINELRTAVNSGKDVIIPEHDIAINQWSGIGYMVLDPDTFACGYMISGSLAGGAMSFTEFAFEIIKRVATGVVTGLAEHIILKLYPPSAIFFAIAGCITHIRSLFQTIKRIYNFIKNEGTRTRELQELMIEFISSSFTDLIVDSTAEFIDPFLDPYVDDVASVIDPIVESAADMLQNVLEQTVIPLLDEHKDDLLPAEIAVELFEGLFGCFIAGTLISTSNGMVPIEEIKAGDMVWSFDPETLEVSEQVVEETFIRQNSSLVKMTAGKEIITSTTDHPFYVMQKGFVPAIDLRAGDVLVTVNGEYVVVEKIQHELLEKPVNVYNFRVAKNHTYYVGANAIAAHNDMDCVTKNYHIFPLYNGDITTADSSTLSDLVKWAIQLLDDTRSEKLKTPEGNVKTGGNLAKARGTLFLDGNPFDFDEDAFSGYNNFYFDRESGIITTTDTQDHIDKGKSSDDFVKFPDMLHLSEHVKKVPNLDDKGEPDGGPYYRFACTEYKLLEFIIDKIITESTIDVTGSFELFTDKPPCGSCKGVIEAFSRRYPLVQITVYDKEGDIYSVKGGKAERLYGDSPRAPW